MGWSFSVPSQNTVAALDLLADVVQHATLPAEALETERAAMLADVARARDDMYRFPMLLVREAAYGDHPYSIPAGGTEESLRGLSREEILEWYREQLLRAPFVIGIVGDVDPADVASEVASRFTELEMAERPAVPVPQWPETQRECDAARDKAQTALAIAFPSASRTDPRRHTAHVVASIASGLGGRFFEELRDRQSLAYTVHAFASEHRLAGMFVAYIATSPDKEERARAGLLAEFAALRGQGVTEDELARAKRYLVGMHDIRQERGDALLGEMIDAWLFGASLSELDEYRAHIEGVSADDVARVSRAWFDERRVASGVVRGK